MFSFVNDFRISINIGKVHFEVISIQINNYVCNMPKSYDVGKVIDKIVGDVIKAVWVTLVRTSLLSFA